MPTKLFGLQKVRQKSATKQRKFLVGILGILVGIFWYFGWAYFGILVVISSVSTLELDGRVF